MTFQPEESGYPQVCPHLGLADDADSHATYSTEAHRCYNLASPTKIALPHQETYCLVANHVTCPVYQGQGIPAGRPESTGSPARGVAAGAGAAAASAGASTGPFAAGRRPAEPGVLESTAPIPEGAGRPPRRRPPPAGPRPRGGGLSMPVATIGLFVLAVGVIALAFVVTQLAGGDGEDDLRPADRLRTQEAQRASTQATTNTPQTQAPTTPAGSTGTQPAVTATPDDAEPTEEPGGGDVYIIQDGDFCSTIADELGVDLQDLLDANGMTEDDCRNLVIGDELIVP